MPTYNYICEECCFEWETEHSIKDPPLTKCEQCGKEKAKRLISGSSSFILKGNGWADSGYSSK